MGQSFRILFLALLLFLILPKVAFGQDWQWAKSIFTFGNNVSNPTPISKANTLAVDAAGNSYITGQLVGTVNYGGIILKSNGLFILKVDTKGNVVWAKNAGGSGNSEGRAIAVDAAGNSYVTGSFWGAVTFDGVSLTSTASRAMFVAKYNANGYVVWAKKADGLSATISQGIAVDGQGSSYVTGQFAGTTTFDGVTLTKSGTSDLFVVKYGPDGKVAWAKNAGGTENTEANAIAVDAAGNCYLTGSFWETVNFGGVSVNSRGSTDIFVAKYDPDGRIIWATSSGGEEFEVGHGIAVDTLGKSYVTGRFKGTSRFGHLNLNSTGGTDLFLAKYTADGKVEWAKRAGGPSEDKGAGVAVDATGNSYLTGTYYGTAFFDALTLNNRYTETPFVAKYDPDGNVLWAKQPSPSGTAYGEAIGIDNAGNSYIIGPFGPTATFGNFFIWANVSDYFVAKLGLPPTEINTAPLAALSYCAGSVIGVSFSGKGTYEAGIVFSVQLSDAAGSFASPVVIGRGAASPITATIPVDTPFGTGYRIRVVASSPATIGPTNGLNLTIHPLPSAPTVIPSARCGPGSLTLEASGAGAGQFYRWYTTASGGPALSNQTIGIYTTPFLSGTTEYFVSIVTEAGCESFRTPVTAIIKPVPDGPGVTGAVAYCQGEAAAALTASGQNLMWYQAATGGTGSASAPVPATTLPVTTDYFVSQTIDGCESARVRVRVTVHDFPAPAVTGRIICEPGQVILRAAGGTSGNYRWYTTATGGPAIPDETGASYTTPLLTTTTTYYVVILNDAGCESPRVPVTATIVPASAVQAGPDEVVCLNVGSLTLGGYRPQGGVWSGKGVTAEGVFNSSTAGAGTHTLFYAVRNGDCIHTSTKIVTVTPSPVISAAAVPAECGTSTSIRGLAPVFVKFSNASTGATHYLWEFGDGATSTDPVASHRYSQEGEFEIFLTAYSENGCFVRQRIAGAVVEKTQQLPNVFTPNGDGLNDTFSPRVSCLPVDLKVFNRWGKLMYEEANYQNAWNGGNLADGVYYYLLSTSNGQAWKGWVEIIR